MDRKLPNISCNHRLSLSVLLPTQHSSIKWVATHVWLVFGQQQRLLDARQDHANYWRVQESSSLDKMMTKLPAKGHTLAHQEAYSCLHRLQSVLCCMLYVLTGKRQ